MITIFILLGLGFLCGGGAAIVDGLPYLVLERGFTQVIIGTVMASAGVVMLALAWVLVELRRLKSTLSGAAMALSAASMAGGLQGEREVAAARTIPEPEGASGRLQPGLVVAAAGALAGTGATLVTAQALDAAASPEFAEERGETTDEAGEGADKSDGPDLFGAHLAGQVEPAAAPEPEAVRDSQPAALPAFDPFRPIGLEPESEPEVETAMAESETEVALETLPAVAADEPDVEPISATEEGHGEAGDTQPAEASAEALPATSGQAESEDRFAAEVVDPASRVTDEFGLLRESLAGLRLDSEPRSGRVEPIFGESASTGGRDDGKTAAGGDDLSTAGNWMEPAWQRRAPWFGEPEMQPQDETAEPEPAAQPETVKPKVPAPELLWPKLDPPTQDLPAWPPQSRGAAAFDPAPPPSAAESWNSAPAEDPASGEMAPEAEPAAEAAPQPPVAEDEPAAAAPAASDEGIVGAYQVGEAHFTIYADGSIQARTPDGDYSFASMDELKVYLASEKSRLGV